MCSQKHFKVKVINECVHVCVQMFSPLLDGNPMHDDRVGDFDLFFYSGGVSHSGPLYGSLIRYLAQCPNDTVGSHLREE